LTVRRRCATLARVPRPPTLREVADRLGALEERVERLERRRAPPGDGRAARRASGVARSVKRCTGCGLPLRRRQGRCAACGCPLDL
jgi:hypothetical protein